MLARMQQQQPGSGLVPVPRPAIVPQRAAMGKPLPLKGSVAAGKGAAKAAKAR
jgi:hypothetical protein